MHLMRCYLSCMVVHGARACTLACALPACLPSTCLAAPRVAYPHVQAYASCCLATCLRPCLPMLLCPCVMLPSSCFLTSSSPSPRTMAWPTPSCAECWLGMVAMEAARIGVWKGGIVRGRLGPPTGCLRLAIHPTCNHCRVCHSQATLHCLPQARSLPLACRVHTQCAPCKSCPTRGGCTDLACLPIALCLRSPCTAHHPISSTS